MLSSRTTPLPAFPAPYPDEIIYSVIARYSRHTQFPAATVREVVFGSRKYHDRLEVPTELDKVAAAMGNRVSIQDIVSNHTLFNYLFAYSPEEHREAFFRRVSGAGEPGRAVLSLGKRLVPRRDRLLFCPQCQHDALDNPRIGEMYWRRVHQTAASFVCATHRRVLRRSTVPVSRLAHSYMPATSKTCPSDAEPVVDQLQCGAMPLLFRLAKEVERLLKRGRVAETAAERALRLLRRAEEVGLASGGKVRPTHLIAAFTQFWGPALQAMPYLLADDGYPSWWLGTLFNAKKQATADPMLNLLIEALLDEDGPPAVDQDLVQAVNDARPDRRRRGRKSQWRSTKRDEQLAPKVLVAVAQMKDTSPPIRITRSGVAAHVGVSALSAKTTADAHLPRSSKLVDQHAETPEAFLRRRIRHELAVMLSEGKPLNAREALRRMGKRQPRDLAEDVLAEFKREYDRID